MSVSTPAELKFLQAKFPAAAFVVSFINEEDPSSYLKAVVEELSSDYDPNTLQCVYVEQKDEASALFDGFAISTVPTSVILAGSKIIAKIESFNAPALVAAVEKAVQASAAAHAGVTLKERLHKLINQAPVMLFMKGSPEAPRCGFSRQIVALFQKNNITFSSFDILGDEEVRQGLKEYSNWPTYPQIYANGELVGGLDVAKELDEAGELREALGLE